MKETDQCGWVTKDIIELTGGGYEEAKIILHLLPFVQSMLVKGKPIEERLLMRAELCYMHRWRESGDISYGDGSPCSCTKKFWDWMNQVLFLGYVLESDAGSESAVDVAEAGFTHLLNEFSAA